jgi:hypothetical protein
MATRIFLKPGVIKGCIEVEPFGYGVSNSGNATEQARGNPGAEVCSHSNVREQALRWTGVTLLAAMICAFVTADAQAQDYDWTGFYTTVGFSVAFPDLDLVDTVAHVPLIGNPGWTLGDLNGFSEQSDSSNVYGGAISGGYRFFPWLAAEAEFQYLAGGEWEMTVGWDLEPKSTFGSYGTLKGDFSLMTFLASAKVYPMALLARDAIPERIQPYVVVGIGGGLNTLDNVRGNTDTRPGGNFNQTMLAIENYVQDAEGSEGAFIARFGGGVDLMLNEGWGAYVDGGYFTNNRDYLEGYGAVRVGVIYRFGS